MKLKLMIRATFYRTKFIFIKSCKKLHLWKNYRTSSFSSLCSLFI